jgi:predicted TIM-barrel fold metal-dependent hydrolase
MRVNGGAVIDVDVHPALDVQAADVFAYLPPGWREMVSYLGQTRLTASPLAFSYTLGTSIGMEAMERLGTPPEPDLRTLHDAFDRESLTIGQLVVPEAVAHSAGALNAALGAQLAGAFNDYLLDRWVVDARSRYALVVIPDDVDAAVAEIRRRGGDPRVSSVWLPAGDAPLGNRRFLPIYKAAVELGLPILSHPDPRRAALATAQIALEGRFNRPLSAWSNIASLVANGVFERFRDLKFVFLECGFSWLDALVDRMNGAWETMREQVPGLARAPSDVVCEHVRIAIHPLEQPREPAALNDLIASSSCLSAVLVYAGNRAVDGLPDSTRRKIVGDNESSALRF